MMSGQENKIIAYLKNPPEFRIVTSFFSFGLHVNEGCVDTWVFKEMEVGVGLVVHTYIESDVYVAHLDVVQGWMLV